MPKGATASSTTVGKKRKAESTAKTTGAKRAKTTASSTAAKKPVVKKSVKERFREFVCQTDWPLQVTEDGKHIVYNHVDVRLFIDVAPGSSNLRIHLPGGKSHQQQDWLAMIRSHQEREDTGFTLELSEAGAAGQYERIRLCGKNKKWCVALFVKTTGDAATLEFKSSLSRFIY